MAPILNFVKIMDTSCVVFVLGSSCTQSTLRSCAQKRLRSFSLLLTKKVLQKLNPLKTFLVINIFVALWGQNLFSETITHLGNFGPVFEIEEENMVIFLRDKLKKIESEGGLKDLEDQWKERIKKGLERPKSVEGLSKTTTYRTYDIDPTLIVESDIQTEKGEYLAKRGDKVNPLYHAKGLKSLLFIDGDDLDQVAFAKAHKEDVDIVLVSGEPLKREEELGQKIYFDQGGFQVNQYQIKHVPAYARFGDEVITVEEVVCETE